MIKGWIILLGILYIIEVEPFYNIIYFIGIIISVSIIIYREGIIYIPLILIIVYSTALIILFGFILMKGKPLFPWSSLLSFSPKLGGKEGKGNRYLYLSLLIFFFLFGYIFSSLTSERLILERDFLSISHSELLSKIGLTLFSLPLHLFLSALLLLFPIFSLLFLS